MVVYGHLLTGGSNVIDMQIPVSIVRYNRIKNSFIFHYRISGNDGKDRVAMSEKKRKTQEERSRETIHKLVEATLDSLQEYGYHGVSLAKIIEKAGVTKGAWSHHFKSKAELIAHAADQMLQGAIESGKEAHPTLKDLPEDERLPFVLDYFWENFEQGKRRDVWVEVYIASRTDAALRKYLEPVIQKFHDSLNRVWREYFVLIDEQDSSVETVMNLFVFMTRGMAIQSLVKDDPDYYRTFRNQWLKMITPLVKVKV